ncbi:MAG: response regulator [Opitutus sp.]|nr:response regulator [Opitutus sp.]
MSVAPSKPLVPSSRPLRIFYAEDVRELRELARMILTLLGHTLECCDNGQLAWDRVRQGPEDFDLIITDHHMPAMNGLEFVMLLRSLPFQGKIIVFSSDLDSGTAVLYRKLNVDRILNKPIPPHDLRQIIADLFPPVAAGV